MRPAGQFPAAKPPFNRIAYAAAHVVADPLAHADPWLEPAIDWERTVAFRRHLWSLGLGVAEAMDTAQRGMGLACRRRSELFAGRSKRDADFSAPLTGSAPGPISLHDA